MKRKHWFCTKNFVGHVLYEVENFHCDGYTGVGVTRQCSSCSCFCKSKPELIQKVNNVFYKWDLTFMTLVNIQHFSIL